MDKVYEIPVEYLTAAGANGRQYQLQSESWDKVQNFLSNMNARAMHDGQVAPDPVSNPIRECHSSQVLDVGVVFDAGEHSLERYPPTIYRQRLILGALAKELKSP